MLAILVLALASPALAMVCTPELCQGVTQPPLACKGGVIKNGGFCGCTDICAIVENEECQPVSSLALLGVPSPTPCDQGLVCAPLMLEGYVSRHACITQENFNQQQSGSAILASKRAASRCVTACQKKSLECTFSMVVYSGQWFAKCDDQGLFLAQQCDNTNMCWCVDSVTGAMQEGSKQLGAAQC